MTPTPLDPQLSSIRPAGPGDAADLAHIHVGAWWQTYRGLLPLEVVARRTEAERRVLWARAIRTGTTRILIAPGLGFAQIGPQRDARHFPDHPEELWALYLLRSAQGRGLGAALLQAARERAFTAWVLEENARAVRFYERQGGIPLARRQMRLAGTGVLERAFGFPPAPA
jgi:GNAT superfamily N-acetyltransferase